MSAAPIELRQHREAGSPFGPPPHSLNAEEAVLGALLLSPAVVLPRLVEDGLDASHFYREPNARLFSAAVAMHAAGDPIDPVTLADHLERAGGLEQVGGAARLDGLTAACPAAGNARKYGAIVRDAAARRGLERAAHDLLAGAHGRRAPNEVAADAVERLSGVSGGAASTSSWAPTDLAAVLVGEDTEPRPTMLTREDGPALLTPGKRAAIFGEPESGKSWLAALVVRERIAAGEHVLYVDFESDAATLVARLRALGLDDEGMGTHLHYLRPDGPFDAAAGEQVKRLLALHPTLAVFDGLTEAYALHNLSINDNDDAARWGRMLPRLLTAQGLHVLEIDHVVKDREGRGRYAIGAQQKLAGVDAAYGLVVVQPFGHGREGIIKLTVEKDRAGFVREHQTADKRIAELRLVSHPDGSVTASLLAPDAATTDEPFRPTGQMERVSRLLEETPGLTTRAVRDSIKGKNDWKDLALELLTAEGYIRVEQDGQARRHHSVRPYREDTDPHRAPVPQPCPNRAPGTVESNRAPVPPPIRARGTGHGKGGHTSNANRAPAGDVPLATPEQEALVARLEAKELA